MFEAFKLLWDFIVLRDAAKKGQLTGRAWLLALGFMVVVFGVAFPALLFYVNHPKYTSLLVVGVGLVAISLVAFIWFGLKWNSEAARRTSADEA